MAIFSRTAWELHLHEDADWVDEATDDMRRTVNLIMGLAEVGVPQKC